MAKIIFICYYFKNCNKKVKKKRKGERRKWRNDLISRKASCFVEKKEQEAGFNLSIREIDGCGIFVLTYCKSEDRITDNEKF